MSDPTGTGASPEGTGDQVVVYPGSGEGSLVLVPDDTKFTVAFSGERDPLSREAQALLREHSAPVAQFPRYGITVYDGPSTGARDNAVGVLNRERSVEIAAPVLHRHTADGDEVYVTRSVMVQFWPEVTEKRIQELLGSLRAQIVRPLDYAANGFLLLSAPDTDGLGAVHLANAIRATGLAKFAHPDLVSQRHHRSLETMRRPAATAIRERDGDLVPQQWHLTHARVNDAWTLTTGDSSIWVAVLDDGVDVTHPEFDGRVPAQWDFTDDVGDGTPKTDDDKHGTACAGVAAARGLHASGAAPGCSLMAVRFPAALGDSDEAEMFRWAADNGADVISCSWGPADGTGQTDPLPGATQAAIQYCLTNGRQGKGIVVCWAAGNGNESVDLDGYAANPHVVAVAASNDHSQRSWYSDMGRALWISAPSSGDRAAGEKAIITTDRQGDAGYNDSSEGLDANYTNSFGGTSSATPLVAGVVGLMLSVNADLTPLEIRTILRDTARKIGTGYDANGHSTDFGYGLIDAYEAVRHAQAAAGQVTPAPGQPSILGPATADRDGSAPSFDVDPGGGNAIYYAVEVATSADLLDGGDHASDPGFYGSWQDSPFQASSPWWLPDAVWQRMSGADSLYYRAWLSSSPSAWEDTVVTTENESSAQAPHVTLTGGTRVRDPRGSRDAPQAGRTRDVAAATHAGFDRLAYPGDAVMTSLWDSTNMAWTGFYLAPAPSQGNTSWMSKAQFLRDLGWGIAPIYVGQQWPGGPGSHVLTAAQGTTDAADAVSLADRAGIGDDSVVYLDIEIGGRLPASYLDYVQAWIDGIRGTSYRPGVYCSYLDTPTQIQAGNPDVSFWVFNINKYSKTQFLDQDGAFAAPPVDQSGCSFAVAWQYIQGAAGVPVPGQDGGPSTTLSPVDMDTATVLDPSHPDLGQGDTGGGGADQAGTPSITGPASCDRGGPAPSFALAPAPGSASIFYAVEVATDPALFDSASHSIEDGFFGSWESTPFLASNPYQLPDDAWQSLGGADALYYRAWFSSSQSEWADVQVTTADEDAGQAPSISVTDSQQPRDRRRRTPGTRGDDVPAHPRVEGPPTAVRGAVAPVFSVTLPASARSWVLEACSDPDLIGPDGDRRTPQNYWASEVMPASAVRLAMSIDGWQQLEQAEQVYYRVASSPQPASQPWYAQDWSTPPTLSVSAPWIEVLPETRGRSVSSGPTRVSDPDERLWRGQ